MSASVSSSSQSPGHAPGHAPGHSPALSRGLSEGPVLRLIGVAVCIHGAGQELVLEPKDALLLAYLAIEGPTPRRALASMLWPDVDPKRASANLRQRLFRLRKLIGFELLEGALVASLPAHVKVDLGSADDGAGELLTAVTEADAAGLAPWLAGQRQRRRALHIESLASHAARLEGAGQLAAAQLVAQQLLEADPTSEHAHRQAMRLHYLRGDRAAALLAFDHCEQVLKDEVGTRPSAETLALLQTIEQAQARAWVSGQPLPASVLRPPRMIGRDAELAAAAQAWSAFEVVVVTGEAGVGKSRFLGALFDARDDVLTLRARPGDDAVPLATLLRLVEALAERWPATSTRAAHAQLLKLASGAGFEAHGAIRSAASLGADLLRAAVAGGVVGAEAGGDGLAGVVLDDLQFADDASVDTWREWLDRPALAGLHFGFASRLDGDVAHERVERLCQRADTVVIRVPPLGAAQTESLVASLALAGTDVPAVAAALTRRIGGNPLHLLETIRRALEHDGGLRADRLDTPAQVLDLLEHRLAALSTEGLLLVRIAAIAGGDFSPELAQAVSRRDVLELADAWTLLERQAILDEHGFAHDLMLEAAMRLLPQPIRRVIHARVADFIAARGAPPARLAHHWLQAGNPLAALPQLLAAARLAWRAGRGRETREAFVKAADIELGRGEPDAAFALLFECIEAVGRLSPVADFDAVIERLVPLARTASQRARLVLLQANSAYLHGDHAGSDRSMAEALLLALACGDRMVESECIYDQGCRAHAEGRLRDCAQLMSACATLQRSLGLERLALTTDATKRVALRALGQVREVLDEQERTLPWLIDNGNPVDVATQGLEQLLNRLDLGDASTADAGAPAAWKAILDIDMSGLELVRNALHMLQFHRLRGRWNEAIAVDIEVAQRLAAQGDEASELARERAALYLDLGRPELARPHLETFESDPAYLEPGSWHAVALRWRYQGAIGAPAEPLAQLRELMNAEQFPRLCELVLAAGQWCPAPLSAPLVAPLIEGCRARGLQTRLLPLQALQTWLLARDGDPKAAAANARETLAALAAADLGAALPGCSLWLAQALQRLGREDEAVAIARHAAGWIQQRLADSVPPEFHDSFRRRNPVHRELLALARRLRG